MTLFVILAICLAVGMLASIAFSREGIAKALERGDR